MNADPNLYFINGCMRCELGGTPDCKVHTWDEELAALRAIVLDCGLVEESKWGVPVYTYNGKNIIMLNAFKGYCGYSFFKGVLLNDSENRLVQQVQNIQAGRQIRFTNIKDIVAIKETLKAYIYEAVEIENAGLEVEYKNVSDYEVPKELEDKFEEDPSFKSAFDNLTPGRQRGYLLIFAQPKKSETRIARIEKWMPKILSGLGIHDEYRMKIK